MDKDRVAGAAKQIKGEVKQAVGKAIGDTKLELEGKADKIEGKVQNAVGGLKDTVRTRSKENRPCEKTGLVNGRLPLTNGLITPR